MTAGPYAIGSDHCNGLSKLIEECGELIQVAGKIIGLGDAGDHWDGTNLRQRLEEEIADVRAATMYVMAKWELDALDIGHRTGAKLRLFQDWNKEQHA